MQAALWRIANTFIFYIKTKKFRTNLFPSVKAGSLKQKLRHGNLPLEVEHFGHNDNDAVLRIGLVNVKIKKT